MFGSCHVSFTNLLGLSRHVQCGLWMSNGYAIKQELWEVTDDQY